MLSTTYKIITDLKQYFYHEGFKKYFHNTGWLFIGRIANLAISFFVVAYVARYLGPTNYGLLSYAVSFVGLFSFIANLGIDQVLYRDLVKYPEKENEYIGTAFFLKLIGGLFAFLLVLIFTFIVNTDEVTNILILIIAFSFIFQSFNIINYEFQARVKAKYPTIGSLVSIFILSLLKLLIIFFGKGIIYFAFIYLLESLLYAIMFIFIYKKFNYKILGWTFNKKISLLILKDSWPLLFVSAFTIIYSRIDQVMVKHFIDQTAVGLYGAAVSIAEIWYFIPGIIVSSIFPAIINAKKINEIVYKKRLADLFLLITIISLGISIPIFILAKPIIYIIFGSSYLSAISILQIYVWAGIGLSLTNALNHYLINENKTKILFIISLSGMIINVILNLFLIPLYKNNGAAIATLISYSLMAMPIIYLLKKNEQPI